MDRMGFRDDKYSMPATWSSYCQLHYVNMEPYFEKEIDREVSESEYLAAKVLES